MKTEFRLIIEHREGSNYSAYSPDLPGCVAAGETLEETLELMKEAITFHLEGLGSLPSSIPEQEELK